VDGGLSRSDWILQRLADLTGIAVERTARADSAALGAAILAGLAAGVWDSPDAVPTIPVERAAEPTLGDDQRHTERARWAAARDLSARWRDI
jgi:glycerol kinase